MSMKMLFRYSKVTNDIMELLTIRWTVCQSMTAENYTRKLSVTRMSKKRILKMSHVLPMGRRSRGKCQYNVLPLWRRRGIHRVQRTIEPVRQYGEAR